MYIQFKNVYYVHVVQDIVRVTDVLWEHVSILRYLRVYLER